MTKNRYGKPNKQIPYQSQGSKLPTPDQRIDDYAKAAQGLALCLFALGEVVRAFSKRK